MRAPVLFLLVLLGGCASVPATSIEGGPGQDIRVGIAGVENSMLPLNREGARAYIVGIEVSNNSDHTITVTRISVSPEGMNSAFRIERTSKNVNEMIEPGDEHVFDVELEGTLVRPYRPDESRAVAFRLLVALSNEQTYFYTFEGPVVD